MGAEQERFELAEQLAAIVESSTDAIIGTSLDGTITSWNTGAERTFGYPAAEIIGRPSSLLIPPVAATVLVPILERVRRGERVEHFEADRLHKDGSIIQLSSTISPIRDVTGAVVGLSTVGRDMTGHNRAEAERRTMEHQLHQAERLQSLGQLAGGIAHDFNNLLAAIMNYAGFVAEQTSDRPAVRADAEQIQAAAERAARLTRQLLIFSRRQETTPETLDLNAIVADIRNLLSRSIGAHIELTVILAPYLPPIEADRGQIEQVLLNLAVNARDAMPHGGTLTIATSPVDLDASYTASHPGTAPGRFARLTVADTGTGMSEDVAAHLFEPFFTTKPQDKGTGLGLSTVYGIVIQSGGGISIDTVEGSGTTFRLCFPAGANAMAAAPGPASRVPGHGELILVVDDEPAVLEVTGRILRQNGYSTLQAATYEQALSLAATHDLELLLTDSVMPRMSGQALAERITATRPGLPVVYMSGYSETSGPQGAGRPGAGRIQKPFNSRTLLQTIHTALRPRPEHD
jgi:two-component system cell cycle sensor histidine kinase/response regulator CckA